MSDAPILRESQRPQFTLSLEGRLCVKFSLAFLFASAVRPTP
jgi:hypothetical protein